MKKEGGEKGSSGGIKIGKIAEAPLRALRRARDAYVNGMTGIAGKASSRGIGGAKGYHFPPPRPAIDRDEELRELIKAASTPLKAGDGQVSRSQSVGIFRIDENEVSDFVGDLAGSQFWPRSQSCGDVMAKKGESHKICFELLQV